MPPETPTFREEPNPDAQVPTGMCGSPKKCAECPSTFLCFMKAKAEKEIIDARYSPGRSAETRRRGTPARCMATTPRGRSRAGRCATARCAMPKRERPMPNNPEPTLPLLATTKIGATL